MGTWRPGRREVAIALVGYAALLAVVLLAPSSHAQSSSAGWLADLAARCGAPAWAVTQGRTEFVCNALILMPLAALGSWLWPRSSWQDWTAYTFAIAVGIEFAQGLLLPARTASFADVVANTLGGLAGAAVAGVVRWRLRGGRSSA